jgi:hypothetical protein
MHDLRLFSVVKIAIVLGKCNTEEQLSVLRFLCAKVPNTKDIHKEMFPVYGGKCLSRKVVHNWDEKFCQVRSKVADDARPGAEVTEISQDVYAADFDAIVKRLEKKMNVLSKFYALYIFCDLFTDSL